MTGKDDSHIHMVTPETMADRSVAAPFPDCLGELAKAASDAVPLRPISRNESTNFPLNAPRPVLDPDGNAFPLTELGNAYRLRTRHGEDLRFCQVWDDWLVYDGRRWRRDTTGGVWRRAMDTVTLIGAEVARTKDTDERKAILSHARRSQSRKAIDAMIDLAKRLDGIHVEPTQLDTNPWLFNCSNGTIDLRTGKLMPHQRGDLITMLSPVAFNPTARCPRLLAFLQVVMGGNLALCRYLQRFMGYAMTGDISEHVLGIFYGTGANGKTTFLLAVQAVFGDYARTAPPGLLMAKKFENSHPCDLADLQGARLVVDSEVNDNQKFDAARMKRLTGGDKIKARRLYEDFTEFSPTHQLVLALNHKPIVKGDDVAVWRRLRLVPWQVTISEHERDPHLSEKLQAEAEGILVWLVKGCLAWQRDKGLTDPPEVQEATAQYKAEMDVLGEFLDDNCVFDSAGQITARAIYELFTDWCRRTGNHEISRQRFAPQLAQRVPGFRKARSAADGSTVYYGIRRRVDSDPIPGQRLTKADVEKNLDAFLSEQCVIHKDCEATVQELFDVYFYFTTRIVGDENPMGRTEFTRNIEALGLPVEEDGKEATAVHGIGLRRLYPDIEDSQAGQSATKYPGSVPEGYVAKLLDG